MKCSRRPLYRLIRAAVYASLVAAVIGVEGCTGGNTKPVVSAGSDQNVALGALVSLTGAASDADGDTLTYAWTQTSGTPVTLNTPDAPVATFTAPSTAATLAFQLEVDDGHGNTATASTTVNVGGGNTPPTVSAGKDQTVTGGRKVTLTGAATDIDGDTLTLLWSQTAGPAVQLSSTTTATTTFTAPGVTAITALAFRLTADDGHGNTVSSDVKITAVPLVLFVANFTGPNITSYQYPATLNGDVPPKTNLAGSNTQLNGPADVVIDNAFELLVGNFGSQALTIYSNGLTVAGNTAPVRVVQGAATGLGTVGGEGPVSLAYLSDADALFVAKTGGAATILQYSGVSTSAFNGNVAPTHTITLPSLTAPRGINLDVNGNLYVADNATNVVLVYEQAINLNGAVSPSRTIVGPPFTGLFDVFVDRVDQMFAVSAAGGGRVNMFGNASTLNGQPAPSTTLTVTGSAFLSAIDVDADDHGYIIDNTANRICIYDAISTLSGVLPPNRIITGADTLLVGPIRLFLLEF